MENINNKKLAEKRVFAFEDIFMDEADKLEECRIGIDSVVRREIPFFRCEAVNKKGELILIHELELKTPEEIELVNSILLSYKNAKPCNH